VDATAAHADPTDVVGRRIGAGLIDLLVLAVVFVVLGVTIGDSESGGGRVGVRLTGGPFVVFLVLSFLYYFAAEAATGRTLGKAALGLRVRSADGSRARPAQILGRTLLRVVDSLPFLYLVGLISIVASGDRRQRLGDLAARTQVVRG